MAVVRKLSKIHVALRNLGLRNHTARLDLDMKLNFFQSKPAALQSPRKNLEAESINAIIAGAATIPSEIDTCLGRDFVPARIESVIS